MIENIFILKISITNEKPIAKLKTIYKKWNI